MVNALKIPARLRRIQKCSVRLQHEQALCTRRTRRLHTVSQTVESIALPFSQEPPSYAPRYQPDILPGRPTGIGSIARDTTALHVGRVLHEQLATHDVRQIFGTAQASTIPEFRNTLESKSIHTVLAQHEQGAGHMAEGHARATGKASVAFVQSGTSLTNMITPMQDALCDGIPMVVISVSSDEEVDILGLSASCTKWNVTVGSAAHLPRRIDEAFAVAMSGRPGPVLVHLKMQYDLETHQSSRNPVERALVQNTFVREAASKLRDVAHLVDKAKKPVIYAGQGMLARPEGVSILKQFTDKTKIPVTTSLQGLGVFDELDPKALHMLGMHGSGYANMAMQEADLILALGARFDDRVTGNLTKFAPAARLAEKEGRGGIVHFDIAPKNINKVLPVAEEIWGDCTAQLERLGRLVKPVADRPEWFQKIELWKRKYPLSAYNKVPTTPEPGLIRAQAVIARLSELTNDIKEKTIISTGVGQHQMWAAQHFRWRYPRTMLTSGGLGTMGYGLPAAIGAKLARPDCLVIDIDGDASFNMTIAELLTAAEYNIGAKVLLFNNEQMGMISDLQRLYYSGRFAQNRQRNPDFVQASQSLGVQAARCSHLEDVDDKLKWLIESDGPAVLEVVTEQHSPVWPVVPAGKGLHEFITYT